MFSIESLGGENIRENDKGHMSIYDIIEHVGGKSNPRIYWNTIVTTYPEVVNSVYNFQFTGQGQRPTPVCDRKTILYIIGVLPGAVGNSYREDAAREMCKKFGVDYDDVIHVSSETISKEPIDYSNSQLATAESESNDLTLANLKASSAIAKLAIDTAEAIVDHYELSKKRFNEIENTVRFTVHDMKAEVLNEVRESAHALSEDGKEQTESLQQALSEIKGLLPTPKLRKKYPYYAITFHLPSEKVFNEILELVEKSGMTRSGFCAETLMSALGITE